MPNGVVQWFDEEAGEGRVVHAGRRYRCSAHDTEPGARHAGTRVRFDIGDDGTTAQRVRPLPRTRSRHRTVGDLAGAHEAWAKGTTAGSGHDDGARDRERRRPLQLARRWAEAVAAGDEAGLRALYRPDVVVSDDTGRRRGTTAAVAATGALPVFGHHGVAELVMAADTGVVVRWGGGEMPTTVHLRLEHGEVVAQHTGEALPRLVAVEAPFPVEVSTTGDFGDDVVAAAVQTVVRATRLVTAPVLFARVKLGRHADPAVVRPVLAEDLLDVDGDRVRARVSAGDPNEAVDLLERRLHRVLTDLGQHTEWNRPVDVVPEPGEWRHGNLATHRPPWFDRPADERRLVRHKTWTPEELTVDEAVSDLELGDLDFSLFRELRTGSDSLIARDPDLGLRLHQLDPDPVALEQLDAPVTLDPGPAPSSTLEAALERLDAGGEPWVFFRDTGSGRGTVVYRRYDGHYGLISPEG